MKIKSLIFLVIFVIFAGLSFGQINMVSAATQPVTSPVTYFTYLLRGKVSYRLLKYFFPVSNVTISAKNLKTGETFSAKTDKNGLYTLTVRQTSASAVYVIKPTLNTLKWTPAQYQRTISGNSAGLDFVGTLR